jgi:dihydroorotate dehydrogenase
MFYPLVRKFLFLFYPEISHLYTLKGLKWLNSARILTFSQKKSPKRIMGIDFPNPIGLAAGFDKNGEYIDALAQLGFGFIEVGTITPKPQAGNPKPRIFRLPSASAVINRLGFNNKGVDYLIEQLQKTRYRGVLGINIGKNKDTPNEHAVDDYVYCFKRVVPYASYITVNISSPNTPELRNLQHGELLQNLLRTLKKEQQLYFEKTQKYVPLVVKVAPDLTHDELQQMANIFLTEKIDGVIATNTTLKRNGVESLPNASEAGGLSGKPLARPSTEIIKQLSQLLNNQIPIIGCGGVMSVDDAKEKFAAGASLIQIYTGLIYKGPGLIKILHNYSASSINKAT